MLDVIWSCFENRGIKLRKSCYWPSIILLYFSDCSGTDFGVIFSSLFHLHPTFALSANSILPNFRMYQGSRVSPFITSDTIATFSWSPSSICSLIYFNRLLKGFPCSHPYLLIVDTLHKDRVCPLKGESDHVPFLPAILRLLHFSFRIKFKVFDPTNECSMTCLPLISFNLASNTFPVIHSGSISSLLFEPVFCI